MKKLIRDNAESVRQMAQLEGDLQQAKAAAEKAANEKVEAERAAAEAAKKASEDAEVAKAEAAASVVAAFMAEGVEGRRPQRLGGFGGGGVRRWVGERPRGDVVSLKGRRLLCWGEFFTQALIYRSLARHLKIEPKAFDPTTYGLPPSNQIS
ncbi:unnamed protein product, partial [Cuscuta europaea]